MSGRMLWTVDAMAAAMRALKSGPLPEGVTGVSIDSRSIADGEAFFAIAGDNRDGHAFVDAALRAGAALAVVSPEKRHEFPSDAPLLEVPDVLTGLRCLAQAARTRSSARVAAVTGSVGKTGTKEALRLALSMDGPTHASAASYNNHWGVPLSLARCPTSARYAVFELGMNHADEIKPLVRLVRPHVAIVTNVEPVHLEFFSSVEAIAKAKGEIFLGVEPGGAAVINRDNPHFTLLERLAKRAGVDRVIGFGEDPQAEARLTGLSLNQNCSTVSARILDHDVTYKIGAPGRHLVVNSLAVLAAVSLLGGDLALAALSLADFKPVAGRGTRAALAVRGGSALLIDESYNANPASMRAALALLGQAPVESRGRRLAVLGDMLELGPQAEDLHRALVEPILANHVDLVFCCGPLMRALWEALPAERRGGYADDSAALARQLIGDVRAGDAIMVKGSFGSRMGPLVKALERQYPPRGVLEHAPAQG